MAKSYAPYANEQDIKPPIVDVQKFSIDELMKDRAPDWLTDKINYLYKEIRGVSLYDELLRPVAGDFYRLKANAQAWRQTASSLMALAGNLEYNARLLTMKYWRGAAADAFKTGVVNGLAVGLMAWAGVAKVIAKGFSKVADAAVKGVMHLAEVAIPKVINLIRNALLKAIPGVGQVSEIAKALLNWELPYYRHVEHIVSAIESARGIIDALKGVAAVVEKYKAAFNALKKIVDSIQDVDETVGPSYADLKTIAQNTKKSADGVIAYTGKPGKDKHGNWVRDDDGRVVFTDSEHTRAMKKLKNEYKDLVAKLDRHRGGRRPR